MKKALAVLLSVLMLLSVVGVSAFAADEPAVVAPVVLHICPNHTVAIPELDGATDAYLLIKAVGSEDFVHYESDFVFTECEEPDPDAVIDEENMPVQFNGAALKFAYVVDGATVLSDEFVIELCHNAVEPYHYDDLYHWNVCSICGDSYDEELHSYNVLDEGIEHTCSVCGAEEPTDKFETASVLSGIMAKMQAILDFLMSLLGGLF